MLELQENKNSYLFQLPVRNRGNMHVRIAGKVEIRSEAGQILEDFTLTAGKGFLLPGHERVFRNEMQTSLPDGFYVAKVDLHREGHTQPMTNNFAFYVEAGEPKVGELSDEIRARLDKQSAGFTVTPGETTVSLRPGARRMQAVTLTNLTRDTFTVRARPAEWVRNIDGRDLVMDGEASHGHSASGWIDVRSPEITLRPLGKSRVPLFVSLPKEAIGEGYAAVAFNRDGVNLDDSPAERSRRSARLRVIAEGSGVRSAEIEAFESARLPNGAFEFILRFRNTGALGLFPDVSISILDKDSNQAGRITLPDVRNRLYQAGQTGEARAQYNQILDPGDYTASLNFAYSDTQPAVSRRTTFTVPEVTAPSETAAAD
ncbi:hypothetical protein HQ520_14615 [bacterium]|nr:hypothetical protein [bacterium]